MATATESKIDAAKAEVAAEKAYAAAAATVEAKVEAPKAVKAAAPAAKAEAKAAPAPKKAAVKAAPKKVAAKPVAAKKALAKAAAPKKTKTVKAAPKAAAAPTPVSQFKDTIMTKTKTVTEDLTAKVKETVAEAQERAKAAYDKGTEMFGEYGEFAKGNVEALVESGKILATGLQTLGKDYVTEGKSAVETVQADIKELAAVKSPADFFKLQGEILRRNFDAAVASGSKHSEMVVKLAGEAFAPIQNRVSIAVEKVKQAA